MTGTDLLLLFVCRKLEFASTTVGGTIPETLSSLTNLQHLNLADNVFTGAMRVA